MSTQNSNNYKQPKVDKVSLNRLMRQLGGPRSVADLYPVTTLQHGLLFHSLYDSQSTLYIATLSCKLVGELDVEAFKKAWKHVLERHDILRTAFVGFDLE